MASLRGDCETQATLINCVLGIYLRNAWYKEADKFFTKVTFPEMANNNEWARYVFYTGYCFIEILFLICL
jgi:26S proteasome regulatory subunit N3